MAELKLPAPESLTDEWKNVLKDVDGSKPLSFEEARGLLNVAARIFRELPDTKEAPNV